jgi:hypothetical protein
MSGNPRFELAVSLPAHARYAETARELVVFAAKQSGCSDDRAAAFGQELEEVVRVRLAAVGDGATLPVVVRLTDGPVQVLVDGRAFSLDPDRTP